MTKYHRPAYRENITDTLIGKISQIRLYGKYYRYAYMENITDLLKTIKYKAIWTEVLKK